MGYINDVFISYKRGKINEEWLNDIFLPFFSDYLNNELPYEPKIFVDRSGLTPGVDFEKELFKNLIYSKCLVSIWSPPYFRRSEWCANEFLTMRFKQEYHQLNENTLPKTLLWPIMYRNVDPLPKAITTINYLNYCQYNVVGEAFFKTEKFLQFQEQLQSDILSIKDIILNAPKFNDYWDTPEGKNKLITELQEYINNNNDFEKPVIQKAISWNVTK